MKKNNLTIIILAFVFSSQIFAGGTLFIRETVKQQSYIEKQKELDELYSDKRLGSFVENDTTIFRLFAPSAVKVELCLFSTVNGLDKQTFEMKKDENGVWEFILPENWSNKFYGFKVYSDNDLQSGKEPVLSVDPYAKAVATYTTYMNPRLSIVYQEDFDWGEDTWLQRDWRDLIIYEMHVRDMTIHPSSGVTQAGSYLGLTETDKKGGLNYIKSLGVNTVELLPSMEFGTIEIPYMDSTAIKYNTWNPYERNHWGYMTSNFFAPAAYYATGWKEMKWNNWMGADGKQVNQFKEMVKSFHSKGIAVMMDVVYNHLSEYEIGNLKQIDKTYYFRLDENGNYISKSYCGNDLRTEAPMMRRLIVESILYWMKEYHIDGFRFDLGKLLDWETIETIIYEAKKINPNVVFVCEPWGGGYDPNGFSLRGWGAWNDQIRNGIKGENPFNGLGWIFGKWYGNNNIKRIESYVNGTLTKDKFGLFLRKEHSVNYLESHDGYTLGDFIRIATKEVNPDEIIKDIDNHVKLTPLQLKLNKLAALFLFTSQGITMIHEGQEFARSKVIPWNIDVPDKHKGHIDHNSYDKDNETNYINYKHAEINKDLLEYYKGLISLRNSYDAFRKADYEDIVFNEFPENEFALAYLIKYKNEEFFVAFNANQSVNQKIALPEGDWDILVNKDRAGIEVIKNVSDEITLEPATGSVLKKRNN